MKVMPYKKYIILVQDLFNKNDYKLLCGVDPNYKFVKFKFKATKMLHAMAYKRADLILTQAKYYTSMIAKLYKANPQGRYLPNLVKRVPNEATTKIAKG